MARELDAMSNDESNKRASALAEAVRSLAGPDRVVLQKRFGQAAVAQAQLGVRSGKDPYGKSWVPLTSRKGQPLRRTGNNIQRSWTAGGETPNTFRFGSRFKYLATHQYGVLIRPRINNGRRRLRFKTELSGGFVFAREVTIPRRQLVPEKDTGGLGAKWLAAFGRVVDRYLAEKMKKAGVA